MNTQRDIDRITRIAQELDSTRVYSRAEASDALDEFRSVTGQLPTSANLRAWFEQYDYEQALEASIELMNMCPGLEPRSALKQAASDQGIPEGIEMGNFVVWAESKLHASSK